MVTGTAGNAANNGSGGATSVQSIKLNATYEYHNGIQKQKVNDATGGDLCDSCGLMITGNMVSVVGKQFHLHCFQCFSCRLNFRPGNKVTFWKNLFFCGKCMTNIMITGTDQLNGKHCRPIMDKHRNNSETRADYYRVRGDPDSAFGQELAKRLAAQYDACQTHIVDGTPKLEPRPASKRKGLANSYKTTQGHEQPTKNPIRIRAEKNANGRATPRTVPESNTESPIIHSHDLAETNEKTSPGPHNLHKPSSPSQTRRTNSESEGKVATLIKLMESLIEKEANHCDGQLELATSETEPVGPDNHHPQQQQQQLEKLVRKTKNEPVRYHLGSLSGDEKRIPGAPQQSSRTAEATCELDIRDHTRQLPPARLRIPKSNRNSIGSQLASSAQETSQVTPVQRAWPPVRPSPMLSVSQTRYNPTPFLGAGCTLPQYMRLSNTQQHQADGSSSHSQSDDHRSESHIGRSAIPQRPEPKQMIAQDQSVLIERLLLQQRAANEQTLTDPEERHAESARETKTSDTNRRYSKRRGSSCLRKTNKTSFICLRRLHQVTMYPRFRRNRPAPSTDDRRSESRKQVSTENDHRASIGNIRSVLARLALGTLLVLCMMLLLVWLAQTQVALPASTDEQNPFRRQLRTPQNSQLQTRTTVRI